MSQFAEKIRLRLAELNRQIASAKPVERRALQKERSALEQTLQKVTD